MARLPRQASDRRTRAGRGLSLVAVEAARALGLDGWVRNRDDGSVDILAIRRDAGDRRHGERLRHGPRGARVTAVVRSAAEDDGSVGFEQRASVKAWSISKAPPHPASPQ